MWVVTLHAGVSGLVQSALTLNRRSITRASDMGDPYPGPNDFSALSQDELVRVFGKDGLSKEIFEVAPRHWSSPLRSGFGWHTVFVSANDPGRQANLEEARDRVRNDYLEGERRRHNEEALSKLRSQFTIIRE